MSSLETRSIRGRVVVSEGETGEGKTWVVSKCEGKGRDERKRRMRRVTETVSAALTSVKVDASAEKGEVILGMQKRGS